MKIRAIILSALILCGISAVIMYSRAAQPQQKSSVITQAINDKNTPMVIKNLILKMKEQMEVNDDQFPELIKEVENYTNSLADSASVAVLHSMLAEMYQNYYQRNQWTINQRTQLSGYIPEDIRVWTSNLFTDKIKEEIERYSIIRAVTAVERADVCIIVIDATEGVTEQDAKIAGIAHDRGKGIIIAVNKWDAIEKDDKTIYRHTEKIRDILSFMPYAEIIFISAKSGQRLNKIFETIDVVIENNSMRVATGVLNEIVTEAVAMQQPPSDKGKRLRIYYTTQVSVKPPTFVIFVNDKQLMHFSYTRYLENRIRDTFGFRGTALRFIIRERKENEK